MTRVQQRRQPSQPTAVLYARMASSRPADRDRLTGQLISCRLMAERLGAQVIGEFTDPGVSGSTTHRPGIEALLKRLEEQPVDYVIATDLGRLGRSHAVALKLILEFQERRATAAFAKPNVLMEATTDREEFDAS